MGTAYLITSAGLFVLEIILQLLVVAEHSKSSEGLFVALLTIVMAPLILINFVSAIQVTRTQDFSDKNCGRIICIVFHAVQLGVLWRSLKLLILFEDKDWVDYLKMRLFHAGFHSLPFAILVSYGMFIKDSAVALYVVTVIVSVISASVALTTYQTGSKLFEPQEFESRNEKIRKHVGVTFLSVSTFLLLLSRCSSIVLFSVAEAYWIFLPLCIHFGAHFIPGLLKLKFSDLKILMKIAVTFYMSFVSLFELVRTEYTGVKCSYVLFYTAMLVENLVFGFYWMLTASYGEMFKLMTVVVILLSFIIGIIVRFSSSGCIYNIESDILTDAFTNPELKQVKENTEDTNVLKPYPSVRNTFDKSDGDIQEVGVVIENSLQNSSQMASSKPPSVDKKSIRSKPGSSSASSSTKQKEYHNPAFVHSQGNISALSHSTPQSSKLSRESQKHSNDSGKLSRHKHGHLHQKSMSPRGSHSQKHEPDLGKPPRPKSRHDGQPVKSDEVSISDGHIRRSMIKVSDRSIHATPQQTPVPSAKHKLKASNADLASSQSRYSRNTHTLQSSVQNYGYNGFDDPYREKRLPLTSRRNKRNGKHGHSRNGINQYDLGSICSNMDYSLDSSELYPSISSDTSSMTSYSNDREYGWNRPHRRKHARNRNRDLYDGYLTDVSNSDDLSFTDYSVDDSCSCSESSDSDGAVTWPPSHTSNLADMYNLPDKVSSTDNIMHWLETMASDASVHGSFSTLPDPSVASDTDMSLSALQTFEVKKEHKRFRKLLPKPKEVFLKFRSLNYKDKKNQKQSRPYPLKHINGTNTKQSDSSPVPTGRVPLPTMPLPIDSVQESIV